MPNPVAVILRFSGDPEDLIARFEQARRSWIDAQPDGYSQPVHFAICESKTGIVVLTAWETEEDHKAFRRIGSHLRSAGMGRPDGHEHLEITRLGWDL